MFLADRLTLDAPRRTKDGYLAVRAKVARTGIYDYAGFEVDPKNEHGLRDKAVVKVFRPGDEVFDRASIQSFIGKPITNDHPSVSVTADNWRQHARGTIMGAMRDGEYAAFDLLLTDKAAIDAIESGKRELSNGYATDLDFTPGTHGGVAYDAVQRSIRGNHVALVDRGRAGSECAIKDGFPVCDAITADQLAELKASIQDQKEKPAMAGTIIVDGLPVSLADEAAVRAVIDKKDAAIAAANQQVTDLNTQVSTLQGEKAALEQKVKDAEAQLDPAALDKRVSDRATLVGQAKAILPTLAVDGKTDAEIRRTVVISKLDSAKDMDDAAIAGAFAMLAKDAKPAQDRGVTPITVQGATTDTATIRDGARAARYA